MKKPLIPKLVYPREIIDRVPDEFKNPLLDLEKKRVLIEVVPPGTTVGVSTGSSSSSLASTSAGFATWGNVEEKFIRSSSWSAGLAGGHFDYYELTLYPPALVIVWQYSDTLTSKTRAYICLEKEVKR